MTSEAMRPCSGSRPIARERKFQYALPLLRIDHLTGIRNGVNRDGIALDQR